MRVLKPTLASFHVLSLFYRPRPIRGVSCWTAFIYDKKHEVGNKIAPKCRLILSSSQLLLGISLFTIIITVPSTEQFIVSYFPNYWRCFARQQIRLQWENTIRMKTVRKRRFTCSRGTLMRLDVVQNLKPDFVLSPGRNHSNSDSDLVHKFGQKTIW